MNSSNTFGSISYIDDKNSNASFEYRKTINRDLNLALNHFQEALELSTYGDDEKGISKKA